jgi:hypothetical protein
MLATITTDLDKIAPKFEIQPEQITIIKTPAEFYETLKVGFHFFMSHFHPANQLLHLLPVHYYLCPCSSMSLVSKAMHLY